MYPVDTMTTLLAGFIIPTLQMTKLRLEGREETCASLEMETGFEALSAALKAGAPSGPCWDLPPSWRDQ